MRFVLEELESRRLLAAPTVTEQILLERLNDARANPVAYGNSIGLNLNGVAPSQPLAFDPRLIDAARGHSADMNGRNYFSHAGLDGSSPGQRITSAGYTWNAWGESIAAGYDTPEAALSALVIDAGVPDLGHRRHLLAMTAGSASHKAVGIGIVHGSGTYRDYYSIDTGSDADGRSYLTGVVYNDLNADGRYNAGEGLGNVAVSVSGIGGTTTWATGGYSLRLGPGTYTVTYSGANLGAPISQTIIVGSANVRLNVTPTTSSTPGQGADFIERIYERVLGRTPSNTDIAYWTSLGLTPNAVSNIVERSAESRTRLVRDWYQTFLGRSGGPGEEAYWVSVLVSGAPEEAVLAHILGSQEYQDRAAEMHGGGGSSGYIRGLYAQILGRAASQGEVDYWRGLLPTMTSAGVASFFVQSQEYRGSQIRDYYQTLMHRTPGQAEVAYWVLSGIDLTTIRVRFQTSPEFMYG